MDSSEKITTKDLAREEPRAMGETLGGYAWVPRMIDKSRASRAGTIGRYVHPCPVDERCLLLLGLGARTFGDIATAAVSGADVLVGLASAGAISAEMAWFDPAALEAQLTAIDAGEPNHPIDA